MKLSYLTWLLPLLFCCCKKSNDNSHSGKVAFTYATTCDSVITSYAFVNHEFAFTVKELTGSIIDSPVTYAISGLPANVVVIPASQTVSALLGGVFVFNIGNVAPGSYHLDLTSRSAANVTIHHPLTLTILPDPDYSNRLVGSYGYCYDFCQPVDSFYNYASVVAPVTGSPYTITISNVRNLGAAYTVTASVSNVVKIAPQVVNGYTIWGTGNFAHDNPPYDTGYMITIYDTMAHGVDTEACIMHIQRSH